jgi:hypothetical protein
MTRIVTTAYRYKPPPRTRKTAPLAGLVIVTPTRKPIAAKKPKPTAVVVRKAKPCNDNRPEPENLPNAAGKKPAIVTARRPGKRFADVHMDRRCNARCRRTGMNPEFALWAGSAPSVECSSSLTACPPHTAA